MILYLSQYEHVLNTLKQAIENNKHTTLLEICCLVSATTHVPLVAVILMSEKINPLDSELIATKEKLIEFYGYEIKP